jgi:hypothetical protein
LWAVTKVAAEHIPHVERAYIFGGIGIPGRRPIVINGRIVGIRIQFGMANYGKTPGFIECILVGWSKLVDLPETPQYLQRFPVSDLYFPQMTMSDLRYPGAFVTVPVTGEYAVFQRVIYRDIFGDRHFSGSIYRVFLKDGNITGDVVAHKPAYWKWDEDKSSQDGRRLEPDPGSVPEFYPLVEGWRRS